MGEGKKRHFLQASVHPITWICQEVCICVCVCVCVRERQREEVLHTLLRHFCNNKQSFHVLASNFAPNTYCPTIIRQRTRNELIRIRKTYKIVWFNSYINILHTRMKMITHVFHLISCAFGKTPHWSKDVRLVVLVVQAKQQQQHSIWCTVTTNIYTTKCSQKSIAPYHTYVRGLSHLNTKHTDTQTHMHKHYKYGQSFLMQNTCVTEINWQIVIKKGEIMIWWQILIIVAMCDMTEGGWIYSFGNCALHYQK